MPTEISTLTQNNLLMALSSEVQHRLVEDLKVVSFQNGEILCEPGDAMSHVYFPTTAIVSLQNMTRDGASTEISIVGNEGMVGIALFMGGESAQIRALVESRGSAYRLSAGRFKEELSSNGEMMLLMLRYTQSLMTQIAQTALCNRHHSVLQQVCRLLLRSLDRRPDNHLDMTQEFMANVLGVRREGVTDAAGKLQKQGVIRYSRGHIVILNRPELEALSCECYTVVKKETDRLLLPAHLVLSQAVPRVGAGAITVSGMIANRQQDASMESAKVRCRDVRRVNGIQSGPF